MSGGGPEVFNGTVFAAGYWASGGGDMLGVYAGGVAGAGSATLTGTLTQVGDLATASIGGRTVTLRAYSDIANGVLFTTLDFGTFYAFLRVPFQASTSYPLGYTVAGNSGLACLAAGTGIATARGDVAVEQLRLGDPAVLADGGVAPVIWLGRRRLRPSVAAWPVRVRAHAFAPGRPARDLLLSPDHAVAVEGGLIAVRYLCNGATIAQEPVETIEYWHVELPRHAVILANGLAVESYLDVGNRAALGDPATGEGAEAARIWRDRGCGRLVQDPAELAGLRRRLEARTRLLGYATTDDPGVVILADGAEMQAQRRRDIWHVSLPAGTRMVRLCSRTSVPAELSAFSGDRRPLGLAVVRLELGGVPITTGDPRRAEGWHAPESGLRWTGGNALLRIAPCDRPQTLRLQAALLLRYWLPPAPLRAAA